ncbi:MAG: efflux RND transporter periplasmic adaptor subunit [Saprospiraceae bacterium]|nr:efflux RND transporter periplasmic adaptor subunit [Saprospiraceae bacterium]
MKILSLKYIFPLALSIIIISCNSKESAIKSQRSVPENTVVKTEKVKNSSADNSVTALGLVMSENEARPSFKTGGVIQKTYVKEGDFVKKGQLLATLIMDEIEAQVKQAEEGFFKAERDQKRVKNLYADSVATLEQFQNVTTAYEVAKRNVDIARFNRTYSEVKAPISGKIVKQIMKSGEITGPGMPIYAIMGVGESDWKIMVGLVDKDWARVQKNDVAEIKLDAYPGQSFTGKVVNKTSVGGNTSGTFDVEIVFDRSPQLLAAGLTAHVTIQTKNNNGFTEIPVDALVRTNGQKAEVFTIENGKAKKITIEIARISGDYVSVSKGLEGVSEVITIGAVYLEDGEKVSF